MSNFKILKLNTLNAQDEKDICLPINPQIILPNQISLMNYSVEQLRDIIQSFFSQSPLDKLSVVKALKIVSCSLNDSKLISSIQQILSGLINSNGKNIYQFLALWTTIRFNLADFLLKITPNFRKALVFLIFQQFLLYQQNREAGMLLQLGALLRFVNQKDLLSQIKNKYQKNGSPIKITIRKCMYIKTERQQLKEFILSWASFCISLKVERLMQFTLYDNRQQLQYLIENVPSMSAAFINQLKQTINQENIDKLSSSNSKINTVLQTAIKQWLNDKNNYWKIVQQRFDSKFTQKTTEAISYGKNLIKEQLQSQCMTVKLLYHYFEGQYFDFEKGDALISKLQKDSWIQTYRSITQCSSYKMLNFIILNKTHSPAWWNPSDPRKGSYSNKNIKKFIQKHTDFLEDKEKELMSQNKKIEIVFNVLTIFDKQNKKEFFVTFEQLAKYLQGQSQNISYKQSFTPYKMQLKIKQQIKKQHNIIIQAKLVRLLKRSKENITIQSISKQSNYPIETVQLAIKRLVSKNLAEEDEKGMYKYAI